MLISKFPAKQHFASALRLFPSYITEGVVFVAGNPNIIRPNSDNELDFYQNQDFLYLTGVNEPGFAVVYDIASSKLALIAPRVSDDEAVWTGPGDTPDELRSKYEFDEVFYHDELVEVLSELDPATVFMLNYQDPVKALPKQFVCRADTSTLLLEAVQEARVFKSPYEIEIIRQAHHISSLAHTALMKAVRPGINESDLEVIFKDVLNRQGAEKPAYHTIVGVGRHASILHYTKNNAPIDDESDVVLVDGAAQYRGYAADITRTFPVGKKFSEEARAIYEIVLDMQQSVLDEMKPGVPWENMHRLAERRLLDGLYKLGIIRREVPVEAAIKLHVPAIFFPHGLGHFLGIDGHDVNGYPKGIHPIREPGISALRMRRNLAPGMVLTVEPGCYFPGCYFVEPLLKRAFADPSVARVFDTSVLECYYKVGGVRIEDCVAVTETGIDNLTTAPKSIEDIEALRY
ncbi:hypothetical protein GQ42DRAFT_118236 [Ramicandelaber brevisporus]|nr:hypothetical protein GQ42DRAFT_118236 [Ramicandelaber brevisporus]